MGECGCVVVGDVFKHTLEMANVLASQYFGNHLL